MHLPKTDSPRLAALFRKASLRWRGCRAIRAAGNALVVATSVLALLAWVCLWSGRPVPEWIWLVAPVGMAALWGSIRFFLRPPTILEIARHLDRAPGAQNVFVSACQLPHGSEPAFARLTAERAIDLAQTVSLPQIFPWRWPRWWAVWFLFVAGFGGAIWSENDMLQATAENRVHAATLLEEAARLGRDLEKSWQDDALDELLQELERQAQALRERPEQQALAEALRGLRQLQDTAAQSAQSRGVTPLSPEEMIALQAALEQAGLKALATALAEDRLEQAQQLLDQVDPERLAKAWREAMQASRDAASPDSGQNAMQTLRQQLQQKKIAKMSQEQLQKLLNALENLRKQGPDDASPPSENLLAVDQGGAGDQAMASADGETTSDGGSPGNELDFGRGKNLLGEEVPQDPFRGKEALLQGQLGEGASLQELIRSTGGRIDAEVSYQAIYQAMAPGAMEVMERENIPSGSRQMVRRYFEAIRPSD